MLERIPPVTRLLLAVNIVAFVLQLVSPAHLSAPLMLWPLGMDPAWQAATGSTGFQPWQPLTYGFLHADIGHLAVNMFALLLFCGQLEYTWGARRFAIYYFACVVGAGLCQLLVVSLAASQGAPPYPTVGASGGVFGVLLAFGMLFPHQRVMLPFPPIPMKARTLVIVIGVIQLVMGIAGTQSGVAYFAHLSGLVIGWLLIRSWRRQPPFGGQRARRF